MVYAQPCDEKMSVSQSFNFSGKQARVNHIKVSGYMTHLILNYSAKRIEPGKPEFRFIAGVS
jgi:hypothetical protein